MWGPKLCFYEKHENNKKINDTKYDIYQRVICTENVGGSTTICR